MRAQVCRCGSASGTSKPSYYPKSNYLEGNAAIHSDILHGLLTLFALVYNTKSWGDGAGGGGRTERQASF